MCSVALRSRISAWMWLQVLVEEVEARGGHVHCSGRTEGFAKVHFDAPALRALGDVGAAELTGQERTPRVGEYVAVRVELDERDRLVGVPLGLSGIADFSSHTAAQARHGAFAGSFAPLGSHVLPQVDGVVEQATADCGVRPRVATTSFLVKS